MPTKVAINGFGRIGRACLKIALEHKDIQIVAINDLGTIENLAYLLRYDTVYGRYARSVKIADGNLVIDDTSITILNEPDPAKLPWQGLGVEVVIESTGVFTKEEDARQHLSAGAKKVLISAPTKSEAIPTVVSGVNDDDLKNKEIISNASCTTNAAAPLLALMDNNFGVAKAMLTTIHAYTSSQNIVDGPSSKRDFRRGRAAAQNIVPSTTGAAIASTLALPALSGKFDGVSLRVPVAVVSMTDIVFLTKKDTTIEEVNEAFTNAVKNPIYHNILAVTTEPNVSSDFIGDPHSSIVDLSMTRVVDSNLVKVMAWYDNEWGYSNRLIEQVLQMAD